MSIYDEIERVTQERKAAQISKVSEELARRSQTQEKACNFLCRYIKDSIIQAAVGKHKTKMKSGFWASEPYYVGNSGSIALRFSEGCSFEPQNVEDRYSIISGSIDFITDVLIQVLRQSKKDGVSLYLSIQQQINLYSVKWVDLSEPELEKTVQHLSRKNGYGASKSHWIYLYGRILAED